MSHIVDDIIAGRSVISCINHTASMTEDVVYDMAKSGYRVMAWLMMALAAAPLAVKMARRSDTLRDFITSRELQRDRAQLDRLKSRIPDEVYQRLDSILKKKEKYKSTGLRMKTIKPEITWLVNNIKMTATERETLLQAIADMHRKSVPLTWTQGQLIRRLKPQLRPKTYTGEL